MPKKKLINAENTTNLIIWVLKIVVLPIIRTNLYIHLLCCWSATNYILSTSFCTIFVIKVIVVLAFSKKSKWKMLKLLQILLKKYLQNDVAKID